MKLKKVKLTAEEKQVKKVENINKINEKLSKKEQLNFHERNILKIVEGKKNINKEKEGSEKSKHYFSKMNKKK